MHMNSGTSLGLGLILITYLCASVSSSRKRGNTNILWLSAAEANPPEPVCHGTLAFVLCTWL
jgi:hypothetical protein